MKSRTLFLTSSTTAWSPHPLCNGSSSIGIIVLPLIWKYLWYCSPGIPSLCSSQTFPQSLSVIMAPKDTPLSFRVWSAWIETQFETPRSIFVSKPSNFTFSVVCKFWRNHPWWEPWSEFLQRNFWWKDREKLCKIKDYQRRQWMHQWWEAFYNLT